MRVARYINRELLQTLAVTLLVLFVVAVGGRFIGYLQDAAAGKYAAEGLMAVMGWRLPGFLQLILPFAFHIALLLTYGRLYAEHEMAVLQSSGAAPGRLLSWALAPMLLLAAVVGLLSLVVTPISNASLHSFLVEQRVKSGFDRLKPGMFDVSDRGRRVTYAESISDDGQTLNGVFISRYGGNGPVETIWAKRAGQYVDAQTGSRFLLLENGARQILQSARHRAEGGGSKGRQVAKFRSLGWKIDTGSAAARRQKEEALSTGALWDNAELGAVAELHWRIALPMFCLVSGLIAFAVAPVKPRQGRFGKIVPSILVMLGYYLALLANQNALAGGHVPAALGLWPVHALFAAIALTLLARMNRPASQ